MGGFTDADVPDQRGKCFLVTGANTGLGFEASRVLAARGARVLMACRDQAKAEDAMRRIRAVVAEAGRAKAARDPVLARRLWDASVAMTGVDPGLPAEEAPSMRSAPA